MKPAIDKLTDDGEETMRKIIDGEVNAQHRQGLSARGLIKKEQRALHPVTIPYGCRPQDL